jgi:hypothetical protein
LSDTALVRSHLDVSVISPGSTPGVFDKDVILSALDSVSNGEDTMVKVCSASFSDNTRAVRLEGHLIGFNGNSDWLLVEGSLELGSRSSNIFVSRKLDTITLVLALSISSGVSVLGFKCKSIFLDVVEGVVHETAIATTIRFVTIDELLLGVGIELSSLDLLGTFNGTGGGEGPA